MVLLPLPVVLRDHARAAGPPHHLPLASLQQGAALLHRLEQQHSETPTLASRSSLWGPFARCPPLYHPQGPSNQLPGPWGLWSSTSPGPKGPRYPFLPPRPHLCLQGQEIEQPYLQSTLGWITFLGIVVLLPIPIYPLQHWWFLQDHIASDPFEKLLSKKATVVPLKPSDWPKYHSAKPTFQERKSENSLMMMRSSVPLFREPNEDPEWREEMPFSRQTESYSGFSLPFVSSLPSAVSMSLPASRQASALSVAADGERRRTKADSVPKKAGP